MDVLYGWPTEVAFWLLAAGIVGVSLLTPTSLLLAFAVVIALRAVLVAERIERTLRER